MFCAARRVEDGRTRGESTSHPCRSVNQEMKKVGNRNMNGEGNWVTRLMESTLRW